MYRNEENHQISFLDFNQSCGMQLDENNEWVLRASLIPWGKLEEKYRKNFPSHTGRPAKPFRMAFGALIIQKATGLSVRKLEKAIAENPYYQYFIGLESFSKECPFRYSSLVVFSKRIGVNLVIEINDLLIEKAGCTKEHQLPEKEAEIFETFIIDATCSPSDIRYPQDFMLLNDARKKLEEMVDYFNVVYHPWEKPRTYREVMDKQYLAVAKMKKRPAKKLRSLIRKELGCLKRDLAYLEKYMSEGYAPQKRHIKYYLTILSLYEQQKYMFENKKYSVPHRIVSIHQPYIRPIVRGKAKAGTEFGAKYEASINGKGYARLEKLSFEAYNEGKFLMGALKAYKERNGCYPKRVLADKIYRTRENLKFCADNGIRLLGPKLGRPLSGKRAADKETERRDNKDRIEVERFFSREKRCFGAGLIKARLSSTAVFSIAMSILVANIFSMPFGNIFLLCFWDCGEGGFIQDYIEFYGDDAEFPETLLA